MGIKKLTKEEKEFALKCKKKLEQEQQNKWGEIDKCLEEIRYLKVKLLVIEETLN